MRYRLTKSEVEAFCKEGSYRNQTQFDSQTFIYELKAKDGIEGLEASFNDNTITLYLPRAESEVWAHSARVGYENTQKLKNGEVMSLLLEKDFVCMDETVEDQSDNYPNPKAL